MGKTWDLCRCLNKNHRKRQSNGTQFWHFECHQVLWPSLQIWLQLVTSVRYQVFVAADFGDLATILNAGFSLTLEKKQGAENLSKKINNSREKVKVWANFLENVLKSYIFTKKTSLGSRTSKTTFFNDQPRKYAFLIFKK